MDPAATLSELRTAIEDSNYAYAAQCMSDYAQWRLKGGFEPPGGDDEYVRLCEAFSDGVESLESQRTG